MHSHLFSTSCWHLVLSLCTFQVLSIHSPVDLACSRSIIVPPPHASQDHVPALGGCVLCLFSRCASRLRPSLLVRSASFKVQNCNVTRRQLHDHVASVPMQHQRNENADSELQTKQEHCQVEHQR